MPDGLLTLGTDGKIVVCNPKMLELSAKQFNEMEEKLPGVLFNNWPDDLHNNNGTVYLLKDLSQIRAMEAQLARSHRLASLGRMAAAIAREIRNPLGTLRATQLL